MTVWLHFTHTETNLQQFTENTGNCSVALKAKNNLTKEDLKKSISNNITSKNIDTWLGWRAKTAWLDNYTKEELYGTSDENKLIGLVTVRQLEFAFGALCGMIDNILEQMSSISVLMQLTITNIKEAKEVTTASLYLTGAWLVDLINWSLLQEYNRWLIENIGLLEEVDFLKDNLADLSKYLYDNADEWFQQTSAMGLLWNAFKNTNPETFIRSFAEEIIKMLGGIFTKTRLAGYAAGQLVMEFAISWLTAGSAAVAKSLYSTLGHTFTDFFHAIRNFNLTGKLKEAIDFPSRLSRAEKAKSCAAQLGCFISGTLVLTTLGAQPIEALNPATPIPAYQAASTPTSYDPSTTAEFGIQALNATHTLPGDVQDIDREEITPATWRWLHLSYTKPDGTTAQVYLRRPLWWMQQHGARAPGDKLTLLMPEMGIVGRAQLEAILPSTLDTRTWDYRTRAITRITPSLAFLPTRVPRYGICTLPPPNSLWEPPTITPFIPPTEPSTCTQVNWR